MIFLKKIGITLRLYYNDVHNKSFINNTYLKFFNNFDFLPVFIPYNYKKELLDLLDGFIITGGYDIDPKYYNEKNTFSNNIYKSMDLLDKDIIDYCLITKKPLLGICRGLQSLNVFLGGSLYQDLTDSGFYEHDKKELDIVYNKSNSKLFEDINKVFNINSYHHQGIKKLGNNLVATCFSKDGLIEAIEHNEFPLYGVQWHPELINDMNNKIIFQNFLNLI